jgi:hypothetical protein
MEKIWHRTGLHISLLPVDEAASDCDFGKVHRFERLRKLTINMTGMDVIAISRVLVLESLRDLTFFGYKNQAFVIESEHDDQWDALNTSG